MFSRLYPSVNDIDHYDSDEKTIPTRPIAFIIYFVKKLKLPLITTSVLYAIGTASMSLEPFFYGWLVNELVASTPENFMMNVGMVVGLFILITQILSRLCYATGHMIEARTLPMITLITRRHLARYLFGHSYRYFSDDFVGRLGGKVIEMPQAVKDTMSDILNPFQFTIITGITSLAMLSAVHWSFATAAVIYFIFIYAISRWRLPILTSKAEMAAAAKQEMRGKYIDSIGGILLVKLFARHRAEDALLTQSLQKSGDTEQVEGHQFVVYWRWVHLCNAAFQIFSIVYAAYLYKQGVLKAGDVTIAVSVSVLIATHIWWLLHVSTFFFSRLATIKEALDTIVTPHEVVDAPNASTLAASKGVIAFDTVNFSYPNGKHLFKDLSLNIPSGQRVGLVGFSGGGKTSFVRLLLRLFDIQNGSITIDGQNIAKVTQDSLHSAISFIPQESELFHRTIAENIAVGKPGALPAEIEEAAKRARAHDFIVGLTNGYDSVVGERGVKLSGGQRQRIAIARVALRNAPILILDEATSALDSQTEAEVQDSLADLMRGRTTIVIAHRLATLRNMDRIIVFNEGVVVQDGTLADLQTQPGIFKTLWDAQVGGFLSDKHTHHV